MGCGTGGPGISTRTAAGREALLKKKRAERERARAARQRERWFLRRLWSRVRSWFGKSDPAPHEVADRIEVSPRQIAHYPGCPYHDTSEGADAWGYIAADTAAAWTSIGNGYSMTTDLPGLQATKRCADCVAHGPWQEAGDTIPAGTDTSRTERPERD